jgi:hypothetical protein
MPEATVEVLTAAVRVLMVGNRQVTLSVYRQLDEVTPAEIEPFGRVRDRQDGAGQGVNVVGVHRETGALVRSVASKTPRPVIVTNWNFLNLYVEKYFGQADADGLTLKSEWRYSTRRWILYGDESDAAQMIAFEYKPRDGWGADPFFKWKSSESREAAQPSFVRWLAEAEANDERAAQWKALPLIVLAGLR